MSIHIRIVPVLFSAFPGSSSGTCILKDNSTVHLAGGGRSFSSPGYPLYSGIGTCSWNITVPTGEFIKLTFWNFKESCDKNYAEVYDVTNSTSKILGKFCGENVVYSKGNNVVVKYSAPYSYHRGGFIASYEARKIIPARYSCSIAGHPIRTLTGEGYRKGFSSYVFVLAGGTAEFASFDYPLLYPNVAYCRWTLQAPAGYVIQLTFHSFDLQQTQDCQADYVEIKSPGKSYYDPYVHMFGRFCGSSLPSVIQTNYSRVYVTFVSDNSGRFPGFHASVMAVPDREFLVVSHCMGSFLVWSLGTFGVILLRQPFLFLAQRSPKQNLLSLHNALHPEC